MGAQHNNTDVHLAPAWRWARALYAALLVTLAASVLLTWPEGRSDAHTYTRIPARVVENTVQPCGDNVCTHIVADDGSRIIDLGVVGASSVLGRSPVGSQIVIGYDSTTGVYMYLDADRRGPLVAVGVVFAAIVIAFARGRGARAIAGMVATGGFLYYYTAPALLGGGSPVGTSILTALVVAGGGAALIHGISPISAIASVSMVVALGVGVGVGQCVIHLLNLSGGSGDGGALATAMVPGIDMRGLLLGGALIGAIGVLDDVVLTQIETVAELSRSLSQRETVAAALRVGRVHVAAAVNTLSLAYIGASLPLVLLFSSQQSSVGLVIGAEAVAEEIARALIGSVGLILSIPLSTIVSAAVFARSNDTAGRGRVSRSDIPDS